jgi:hypothetical protein
MLNLNLRQIYFFLFLFWPHFLRALLQSWKKIRIWTSCWFQILWKFFKKCTKKVISKTILTNMSNSGKSAYIRHIFASNFFLNFLQTFSMDLKSAWNSEFFYTHTEFMKKIFVALISIFSKLRMQLRTRRLK